MLFDVLDKYRNVIDRRNNASYTRTVVISGVHSKKGVVNRAYQPSVIVRKRRHGFRSRMATVGGRRVIQARRKRPDSPVGVIARSRMPSVGV